MSRRVRRKDATELVRSTSGSLAQQAKASKVASSGIWCTFAHDSLPKLHREEDRAHSRMAPFAKGAPFHPPHLLPLSTHTMKGT